MRISTPSGSAAPRGTSTRLLMPAILAYSAALMSSATRAALSIDKAKAANAIAGASASILALTLTFSTATGSPEWIDSSFAESGNTDLFRLTAGARAGFSGSSGWPILENQFTLGISSGRDDAGSSGA